MENISNENNNEKINLIENQNNNDESQENNIKERNLREKNISEDESGDISNLSNNSDEIRNKIEEEEKKKKKKEEKKQILKLYFIALLLYYLFTLVDIIIQFTNSIGKNILLIDDYIFIFSLILHIISLKFQKIYYYYIVYHCSSIFCYLVNDVIFFVFYIEEYASSRYIFIFFISFCIIKFIISFMILIFYTVLYEV